MCGKKTWFFVVPAVLAAPVCLVYGGEVEARSNPVANGVITVDGSFADWEGVVPFTPDADDAAPGTQNWLGAALAHDDEFLYVRFERAAGSILFNSGATTGAPAGGAGYRMVIDTDENSATGLNLLGPYNLSIGGEFTANGLNNIGRWGIGGACWALGGFPFAAVSVTNPTTFEASIPRAQLGDAVDFNIAFRGENSGDYYPDTANGTDYFHYTTAAPITELPVGMLVSISNPVASGTIQIDGGEDDWAGITPFPADPAGDGGASQDWVQVWIAHDDANFYFRVERAPGSVAFASFGYWGVIDTDRNASTGILLTGGVGAEYNFGGTNVINTWNPDGTYAGTSFPWGAVGVVGPMIVEGSIRRSDIGDPAAFNLVFIGEDAGDFYPDNAFDADYFHYTVHEPGPTGTEPTEVATLSNRVPGGTMVMDGNFDDWAALPSFPADSAGDAGPGQDWVQASIAHDDTNLYFYVERGPGSATFQGPQGQGYWIVLDTDRSKSTGFTGFGARGFSIGGEYNWGGHATNAWDANGCYTGGVAHVLGFPPGDAEFSIPRSTFGNPNEFNVAFIGENSGDLYPDSAATKVFHYTTGAPLDPLPEEISISLSNPVADGAIQVNGDVGDWASVAPYPADPAGDGAPGSQDWVQAWIAHDSTHFYVRMSRAAGSAGWGSPGYWGVFDTDRSVATGIVLGGTHIGAEFNTGGIVGFNAWNPDGSHAGGRSFAATAEAGGTQIEASIALADLGNPLRFRVIYVGENSGDYYPEGANANTTFLYTLRPCSTPFADADNDGDVDHADFGAFQACYSGATTAATSGCECFDRDYGDQGDGDVDEADLTAFVSCLSGPSIPADPDCAD